MSDTDRVDELAKRVLNEVVHIDRQLSETAAIYEVDLVQSLVSSSFHDGYLEGVAKGAEQVKADLETWLLKEGNVYVENTMLSTTHYMKHVNVEDVVDFLHDRLFVLAPTKESEK